MAWPDEPERAKRKVIGMAKDAKVAKGAKQAVKGLNLDLTGHKEMHELRAKARALEKDARIWKQDYLTILREYARTLEQFMEHIDGEIRVLEDKELPLHVAIARVTDSAVQCRPMVKRLEKIREVIPLIEKGLEASG